MQADLHESMRHLLDKSFLGETSPGEEHSLRQHLCDCVACQRYAADSSRVIAGLKGFAFEADPDLQTKVLASLALRAQQLEAAQPGRRRIVQSCIIALLLTVVGSLCASQAGAPIAALFHLQPAQAQAGLFALWIVPSWGFCLFLPVLLLFSAGSMSRQGRTI